MDFSFSALFAGFVFGVFGIYFLKQGKALGSFVKAGIGVALIAFPYFVPSPWTWLAGAVLMLLGFKLR